MTGETAKTDFTLSIKLKEVLNEWGLDYMENYSVLTVLLAQTLILLKKSTKASAEEVIKAHQFNLLKTINKLERFAKEGGE